MCMYGKRQMKLQCRSYAVQNILKMRDFISFNLSILVCTMFIHLSNELSHFAEAFNQYVADAMTVYRMVLL